MTTAHSPSSRGVPDEPHGQTVPMPHHSVPYFTIFWVLVALTAVTVGVAIKFRFQNEIVNVLLALLIASIKGMCVAFYFMHLKYEGKLIYLIFIVPLILCVLLLFALIPDILLT